MVEPVLHRWSRRVIPAFLFLGVVGMTLGAINEVGAQSFRDDRSHLSSPQSTQGANEYQERNRNSQFPSNLPEWAEPSQPEAGNGGIADGKDVGPAPPPPPPPPPQVPVDGGLAILAAAGAGYAVRRLRDDEGEDEDDDMA